jgi:uncharacterized membrane protein
MPLDPAQEELVQRARDARDPLDVGACLAQAWSELKGDFWGVLGGFLVIIVVGGALGLLSLIPILGLVLNVLVAPALGLGIASWIVARARGQRPSIALIFSQFPRFGEALGLYLVSVVLTALGLLLCILPGIYLALAWGASWMLLADRRGSFWECMEVSRRALTAHLGWLILLVLVLSLVAASGALLCGIGLVVSIPLAYLAYGVAFTRLFDQPRGTPEG